MIEEAGGGDGPADPCEGGTKGRRGLRGRGGAAEAKAQERGGH